LIEMAEMVQQRDEQHFIRYEDGWMEVEDCVEAKCGCSFAYTDDAVYALVGEVWEKEVDIPDLEPPELPRVWAKDWIREHMHWCLDAQQESEEQMDVGEVLEWASRCEALYEQATQGPLQIGQTPEGVDGVDIVRDVAANGEGKRLWAVIADYDHELILAFTGNGPTSKINATFFAYARIALPRAVGYLRELGAEVLMLRAVMEIQEKQIKQMGTEAYSYREDTTAEVGRLRECLHCVSGLIGDDLDNWIEETMNDQHGHYEECARGGDVSDWYPEEPWEAEEVEQ
jgi:hypothetical protein